MYVNLDINFFSNSAFHESKKVNIYAAERLGIYGSGKYYEHAWTIFSHSFIAAMHNHKLNVLDFDAKFLMNQFLCPGTTSNLLKIATREWR